MIICRFVECDNAEIEDIQFFQHCENHHANRIHEIDSKNQLTFWLNELVDFENKILKPIQWLLNCGENGSYWFILNVNVSTVMEWGMLMGDIYDAVGYSELSKFTLKIGEKRKDLALYKSGFIKAFDVPSSTAFFINYLDFMDFEAHAPTKCTLYLGPMDDSDDDWIMDKNNVVWNQSNKLINADLVERFTCNICLDYIKSNVIVCANKNVPHFYCTNCFNKMRRKKCFCTSQFNYDGHEKFDKVIKLLKFPDESDDVADDDGSPPINGTLFANRNEISVEIPQDKIPDNGDKMFIKLDE